jgi:AcrR family transcriptional regulator
MFNAMSTPMENVSARERILETATDLFASQGYRATGVNEIIAKSGVAKATFYNHFPTKDDLCLAYLKGLDTFELDSIKEFVAKKRTPWARFLAVIESLEPWLQGNNLRGCSFLNMVAEVPDYKSPALADDYMVIIGGSVALTEVYHDTWPIRQGIDMVARLVD